MKLIDFIVFMALGVAAFAQEVQFDYDRGANFSAYRTYQWLDNKAVQVGDEIPDRYIKRAVDEQLSTKGLRRVESGGDLLVAYEAEITRESGFASIFGFTRIATSTIDIGKLVIGLSDPVTKQLIWQGTAFKAVYTTLDSGKNPDEAYRCLVKPLAKLFRNYPPGAGKQ